jgi:formamidopyrimidine-DNA glycosylase
MPELPEVEHAARMLRRWLVGRRITRVEADPTRVLRGIEPEDFARALGNRTLESVVRRGKNLLLAFDRDVGLSSHLGMTGRWVRRRAEDPARAHSRVRLHLPGGDVVHYVDQRMFGGLELTTRSDLPRLPAVTTLGPDALEDEIDAAFLARTFARRNSAVKVVLMDQTVLAGLGNIQATEALFRARIHPSRRASELDRRELGAVARGIQKALEHTLGMIDTEELAYLSDGAVIENPFLVYGRAGEPCPRCATPLETLRIGGRASALCPRCQPLTRSAPRRGR